MVTTTYSDNGDAKSSAPAGPPPTYAQVAAARPKPQSTPSNSSAPAPASTPSPIQPPQPQPPQPPEQRNSEFGQLPPVSPAPRTFGPTPLPASTTAILPYYRDDPRSEWALREAASRAKRRFFKALLVGGVIWLLLACLVGGAVDNARRWRHVHHGRMRAAE